MNRKPVSSWCAAALSLLLVSSFAQAADLATTDLALDKQTLIQEIDCAQPNKDLLFMELPEGVSKVETILNTPCRVMTNKEGGAKYFAYRIGEGKGLKAGGAYVLTVEYPEDQSRTIYVCNWGCETASGFATGQSIGDVLKGKYVPTCPESLKYPLSGKMQTWAQLFYLHDRFPEIKRPKDTGIRPLTPEDGFWVILAQTPSFQDPLGAGTAISKIRLYEVKDPEALNLKINFPPAGLPRRHVFSREEMADGVTVMGHKPEEKSENLRGMKTPADWFDYKMRVMQFLGIDTFGKDLLEFGHNQGWDSAAGGGDDWVYQSPTPELWGQILERANKRGLNVLPYYEYRGSVGASKTMALGPQRRAKRLDGGDTYANLDWMEATNVDILDPDTLADLKKIIDLTIVKYKDKANFLGAWIRQRPTAMPMSFNEKDIKLFCAEANGGTRITRAHLQANKPLLDKYYAWWFGKRKAFLGAVRDELRAQLGADAFLLYTNDPSEPGKALPRSITGAGQQDGWQWMLVVVNDEMATWDKLLADQTNYKFVKPYDFKTVVDKDLHLRALKTFAENWDAKYEINHCMPPDDPENYQDADGMMFSYTYNRLYTVSSPRAMAPYRSKTGLALMRHYSLNENEMNIGNEEPLGYFICDVERAGPYCMMAEARAIANGDPTLLGSLPGGSNKRGFPGYVRRFHAAFLSLPALPSEVIADAASDPEVVVRAIKTDKQGTWYAIVNTGFGAKKDVVIKLPPAARLRDSATGADLQTTDGQLKVSLDPAELRALHAQ